jgi:hypothetical protein
MLSQIFRYATEGNLQITVATLGGELYAFEGTMTTTAGELKSAIEAQAIIPSREQILIHEGRTLEDERPLSLQGVTPLRPSIVCVRNRGRLKAFGVLEADEAAEGPKVPAPRHGACMRRQWMR